MSDKNSRSGGKYSGNHTTLTHVAALISDIAHDCPEVTRISPGFLKAGLRSVNGQRRVKISDHNNGTVLLSIRDNTSHQEVTVYTNNLHATKLAIAKGARNNGLHISFGKDE